MGSVSADTEVRQMVRDTHSGTPVSHTRRSVTDTDPSSDMGCCSMVLADTAK